MRPGADPIERQPIVPAVINADGTPALGDLGCL